MRAVRSVSFPMLMLVCVASAAVAAEADLSQRLIACYSQRDEASRLACYDREIAPIATKVQAITKPEAGAPASAPVAAAAAPATSAPAVSAPAVAATTVVAAEDAFGVRGSEIARQRDVEIEDTDAAPKRLSAKVTAISQRPRGEVVLTLDNGQIWAQKDGQSYFPIKVGDAVTITAGALGSFRLAAGSRSTQVTRLQ